MSALPVVLKVTVAAITAAGAAYGVNRVARAFGRRLAVVVVAPGLEESLKTGTALALGAPVLATHLVFGGLEAVYDLLAGPDRRPATASPFGRRTAAAAAGLVGHALFGTLTVAVAEAASWWPAGVAAAYTLHVGWNALVMGRVGSGRA